MRPLGELLVLNAGVPIPLSGLIGIKGLILLLIVGSKVHRLQGSQEAPELRLRELWQSLEDHGSANDDRPPEGVLERDSNDEMG